MAAALSAPEILLMVLEHLDFHPLPSITVANRMHGYTGWPVFDVGAVRAFSEVCRSWAALAQPLLFRHAVLRKRRHVLSSLAAIIHGSKTRGRLLRDAVYRITLSVGPDEEDAHAIQRRPSSSDGLFLGENLDQPPNTHDLVNLLRSCPDRGLQLLCVNSVRGKLNGRQPHSEEAHLDTLGLDERALRALKAPPSVTCLSVSTCSDKPDRTPWQLLSLLAPTIKILALTGTGHIPEYNGPALTQLRLNEFIWMKERAEGWSTIPYILSSSIGHLRSIEAEGTHIHPADVLQQHRMHLESVRITQMRSVSSPQQAWLSYPRLKELILDTSDYHAPRGEGQTLLASETMQHLAGRISDDLELWHAVMERLPNLRTVTVGWKDDVRGLEAECAAQSIEVRPMTAWSLTLIPEYLGRRLPIAITRKNEALTCRPRSSQDRTNKLQGPHSLGHCNQHCSSDQSPRSDRLPKYRPDRDCCGRSKSNLQLIETECAALGNEVWTVLWPSPCLSQ